jgi:hypothetical protein
VRPQVGHDFLADLLGDLAMGVHAVEQVYRPDVGGSKA